MFLFGSSGCGVSVPGWGPSQPVQADDLSAYADPVEAVEFECATLSQEQASVEAMIQRTASVGKFMSQLAEGLYYIDKAGFSL